MNSCFPSYHIYISLATRLFVRYLTTNFSGIPIFRTSEGNEKFVWKIGQFEKSGVKLHCLTEGRETTFASSFGEVWKFEGLRNWAPTVTALFHKCQRHCKKKKFFSSQLISLLQLYAMCREKFVQSLEHTSLVHHEEHCKTCH